MSLRSAEKARVSSCLAADNVARAVIAKFREMCSNNVGESQIVLAGIVAIHKEQVSVVSLAVGNKFNANGTKSPDSVRDCHAEVLARRAFKSWLILEYGTLKAGRVGSGFFDLNVVTGQLLRKSHVQWVLYVSSCPCGNACVRRWGDSPKETFDLELTGTQLFNDKPHPPFHPHSQNEGQTGVAMKGQSTIHSCSDKILRWNVLGLQGLKLSGLVTDRILLDGIVIGRKFVRKHAERAFCCRLCSKKVSKDLQLKVHHPSLMCTAIKLDDGPLKAEVGAVFTESVLWWHKGMSNIELIDGLTGATTAGSVSDLAPSHLYRDMDTFPFPDQDTVALAHLVDSHLVLL